MQEWRCGPALGAFGRLRFTEMDLPSGQNQEILAQSNSAAEPEQKVGWGESYAKGAKTAKEREEISRRDPEPLRFSGKENFAENAQLLSIALLRDGRKINWKEWQVRPGSY